MSLMIHSGDVTLKMNDDDDTMINLLSSTRESVLIRRDLLSLHSIIFADMLSSVVNEEDRSCTMTETTFELNLMRCAIEGKEDFPAVHNVTTLRSLAQMTDKYEMRTLALIAKNEIWANLYPGQNIERLYGKMEPISLYRFAKILQDDRLIAKTLIATYKSDLTQSSPDLHFGLKVELKGLHLQRAEQMREFLTSTLPRKNCRCYSSRGFKATAKSVWEDSIKVARGKVRVDSNFERIDGSGSGETSISV